MISSRPAAPDNNVEQSELAVVLKTSSVIPNRVKDSVRNLLFDDKEDLLSDDQNYEAVGKGLRPWVRVIGCGRWWCAEVSGHYKNVVSLRVES